MAADRGYRAAALVLHDPARTDEKLELRGQNRSIDSTPLTNAEAEQIGPLQGNPDPLDAFLTFFSHRLER